MTACEVYFNAACSKCRAARDILSGRGIDATYREYLKDAPSRAELERVLSLLGADDPRVMMRTKDALYTELGLADPSRTKDELLDALARHPALLERPIVIVGDRAVVARPPEKLVERLERR
jgi:arsenate reductase